MGETENESLEGPETGGRNEADNIPAAVQVKDNGKILKIFCAVLAAVLVTGAGLYFYFAAAASKYSWLTSYIDAKDTAKSTGKDVLFCFTGSDWDESSRRLLDIVRRNSFMKKAGKKYILCNFDIVQNTELMAPEDLETNFKLASRYGVTDFPCFVLLTSEGDVYGGGVYQFQDENASGKAVLDFLSSFEENRTRIVALKDAVKNAEGVEKARRIDEFLSAVGPSQAGEYEEMIRAVPDLDKDNEAGLRGKYLLNKTWMDASALSRQGLLNEAADCFYGILDDKSMTPALRQNALYFAAGFYAMDRTSSADKIISVLEDAVAADPSNANVVHIREVMESIRNQSRMSEGEQE